MAIVDAFDAMTTKRVYQAQMLPDEALAKLWQSAGTKFDPVLVKAFISCMGVYPVDSAVLLNSGEVALVSEPGRTPETRDRPVVRLVRTAGNAPISETTVDLASPQHRSLSIVRCVDPDRYGIGAEPPYN